MLDGEDADTVPIAEASPIKAIAKAISGMMYLKILLAIQHILSVTRAKVVNNIIAAKSNLVFLHYVTEMSYLCFMFVTIKQK